MISIKKAAMFGLDARIALAIFGALSVISGAALYSAIQTAKTEQAHQILNEIVKASEQYYLDNGSQIPQYDVNNSYTTDLLENRESLSTWKGPYITGTKFDSRSFINSLTKSIESDARIYILLGQSSTWSDNDAHQDCSSVGGYDCSEWLEVHNGDTADGRAILESIFVRLDSLVDNSDGDKDGSIRAVDYGDNRYFLLYKGFPRKRTI
jgi:type II secretory pathway pseudopilin PulG